MIAHQAPESAREVLISANPRAGRGWRRAQVEAIEQALAAGGYHVETLTDLSELEEAGRSKAAAGRLRAVVAIGGDGTCAVVRNHVPLEIPLVPVPRGTENLLGRYVDQGVSPREVVATLDRGVCIELDLARADGRYFLLMISVGFDSEVIRRLHDTRRGNITRLSYVKPTLDTVRSYTYPELQLYCLDSSGEASEAVRCRWVFGFNLPLYACGWEITPDAVATDGLFDVCAFERGSAMSVLRYLWHVTRRGHHLLDDTTTMRGMRFRIESDGPARVAYQLDGDFGGFLPVEVDLIPRGLKLLVKTETAEKLGFEIGASRSAEAEASLETPTGI